MFKFGFNIDDSSKNTDANTEVEIEEKLPENECVEVIPVMKEQKLRIENEGLQPNCMFFGDDQEVFFVPFDSVINEISTLSNDISCAEQKHSDVVPGVYEGGAKVWECTQDLGLFLANTVDEKNLLSDFAEKRVLDLGCGAGILGILALKAGSTVHFQDYNEAVLRHITIPNAILNVDSDSIITERCRFYSGDWLNYIQATKDGAKFDRILTSETIYNPSNYTKIINVFKEKLEPDGIVYLAAKTFYFGVGGSLRQFENILKNDATFKCETVQSMNDNVAREILKITFA